MRFFLKKRANQADGRQRKRFFRKNLNFDDVLENEGTSYETAGRERAKRRQ